MTEQPAELQSLCRAANGTAWKLNGNRATGVATSLALAEMLKLRGIPAERIELALALSGSRDHPQH